MLEAEKPALQTWARLGFPGADEIRIYRSLIDMTKHGPVLVYATVEDVSPGQVYGLVDGPDSAFQAVLMELRVNEVLAGDSFAQRDLIPIQLGLVPFGTNVESAVAEVIGDKGLFFLLRMGDPQPEFDLGPVPKEQALGLYRTTSPQGLLLNDQGKVRVARYFDRGFPTNLNGTPFSELLETVRSIVR